MNHYPLPPALVRRGLSLMILFSWLASCKAAPTPGPGTPPPALTQTQEAALTATPGAQIAYLPLVGAGEAAPASTPEPSPYPAPPTPERPQTPAPTPTSVWPEPPVGLTTSKLGLHVVRNEDPYIMEFVRHAHPRVMKGLDDDAWLSEVKAVSPDIVTVGRFVGEEADVQDHWPDTTDPVAAAREYVAKFLERYRLNPGVDYWEGWNEFNTVVPERWTWFARFEAERACLMQAHGLRAAVGGFPMGTPEYSAMALFLPALEAAHRCGGIFTLHEGVVPTIGCGLETNRPGIIPGAPALSVPAGPIMMRYRFWYEAYLKPRGLGDLPLVISELAIGGIDANSPCNGPGGDSWKTYQDWWVRQGVGQNGPDAYVNVLAWYDSEMRQDPYVIGATIFTAGSVSEYLGWTDFDLHEVLIPLAHYAVDLP